VSYAVLEEANAILEEANAAGGGVVMSGARVTAKARDQEDFSEGKQQQQSEQLAAVHS